jgi:hypothetical protein
MTDNYAYSGIALNGKFSEDGEYFQVYLELNGVPVRFANLYVGDQRESFQAAADAGKSAPAEASSDG